jgi:hypothetical protein
VPRARAEDPGGSSFFFAIVTLVLEPTRDRLEVPIDPRQLYVDVKDPPQKSVDVLPLDQVVHYSMIARRRPLGKMAARDMLTMG